MATTKLPEWVKPGVTIKWLDRTVWHVRAIVDDRAVMRTWWSGKQRWHYRVEGAFWFEELIKVKRNRYIARHLMDKT